MKYGMQIPLVVLTLFLVGAASYPAALPRAQLQQRLEAADAVPFFISDGSAVPGHDAMDDVLARMAFDAWSRESGGRLRFVETPSEDEALVRLKWVSASEGLFGEARRIEVDGRTGAEVFVTLGAAGLGSNLAERVAEDALLGQAILYLTCVHELGHAIGLQHTRDFQDIMYSFRYGGDIVEYFLRYRRHLQSWRDISDYSGLSDGDRDMLRLLYSGV